MNYIFHALRNPFTYTGRASRSEFWLYALFHAALSVILFGLALLSTLISVTHFAILTMVSWGVFLAGLLILIAVAVRRCHDFGRGGWLVALMILLPPVFILCGCLDGHYRTNRYGPRPHALDF
jgi:uncharacterized membrane protein YhaH (DUF805 family)